MKQYIVETYEPGRATHRPVTAERAGDAAERLARRGMPIRYLRSILLLDDETCFHLFEGESPADVADVSTLAGIHDGRIVEVVQFPADPEGGATR